MAKTKQTAPDRIDSDLTGLRIEIVEAFLECNMLTRQITLDRGLFGSSADAFAEVVKAMSLNAGSLEDFVILAKAVHKVFDEGLSFAIRKPYVDKVVFEPLVRITYFVHASPFYEHLDAVRQGKSHDVLQNPARTKRFSEGVEFFKGSDPIGSADVAGWTAAQLCLMGGLIEVLIQIQQILKGGGQGVLVSSRSDRAEAEARMPFNGGKDSGGVRIWWRRWWPASAAGVAMVVCGALYLGGGGGEVQTESAAFRIGGEVALAGEAPASMDLRQVGRDSTILNLAVQEITDALELIRDRGELRDRVQATGGLIEQIASKLPEGDQAFLRTGYGSTGLALTLTRWDSLAKPETLAELYWLDLSAGAQTPPALGRTRNVLKTVNPALLGDGRGRERVKKAVYTLAPYAGTNPELTRLFGELK